jgi:hypothetical protein
VELQGVEPWSKQETDVLSTCLADYWFSKPEWQLAALLVLSPFFFVR